MKLAVLAESSADESALRILVAGLLPAVAVEPISGPPLRQRGWPAVEKILPAVIKFLYYRTDAESFVTVIDSNGTPVHSDAHDSGATANAGCRLCELKKLVNRTKGQLSAKPGRQPLKVAVGLAVPAIEAWFRCGQDPHVTEAAWIVGMQSGTPPYSVRQLKQTVYGTERPSLQLETERMTQEANRLVGILPQLEASFPNGFGALARDVRSWTELGGNP